MIFTKELLLKGLAGVSLCAGVAGLGIHIYKSGEVKITDPQGQLGLPEGCNLPTNNTPATCNITAENVGNIRFDGKSTTTPPAFSGTGENKTAALKISKDDDFPKGYMFTISTGENVTLTINGETTDKNIVINNNSPVDFRVEHNKENKTFSLKKGWPSYTLAKKVGLEKTGDHWSIGSKAIKVKYETGDAESKTAASGQPGKIKAVTDTTYNKGFKFVIEDGDIALTNVGSGTISKLEEFETYEIKEEGGSWILFRKSKAIDEVKKALGLSTGSSDCPESSGIFECSLGTAEKLKAVNFDGKSGDPTVSDNNYSEIKLKISKTTDTNRERFPHGHKFVLESDKEISALAIKANTNTEFKIKKGENGWSLEKAWTVEDLAAKVGLTGCTTGDSSTKECSFGESISVYENDTKKVVGATFVTQGKKIRYLDKEGYNQGIKFYIPHSEAADISITGGTTTGTGITTISKETSEGVGPSYEIKEINGTWYLAKKTTVSG